MFLVKADSLWIKIFKKGKIVQLNLVTSCFHNLQTIRFYSLEKYFIDKYRKIYDQGIEPKVFINDFLELVYYFKNIESITLESTNFSLNDEEFTKIKEISNINHKKLYFLAVNIFAVYF